MENKLASRIKEWRKSHSFIEESLSLQNQKEFFQNSELARIIPLSTNSTKESVHLDSMYLYPPLMPDTLKELKLLLQRSVCYDNVQERTLIALYQGSGSGKTKLAYSLALEGYFLYIPFVKESDYRCLTNAIAQNTNLIQENCDKWQLVQIEECLKRNFTILQIWSACWVELLIEFDQVFHDSKPKHEMFLRFTRDEDFVDMRDVLFGERIYLARTEWDTWEYVSCMMNTAEKLKLKGIFYDEPTSLYSATDLHHYMYSKSDDPKVTSKEEIIKSLSILYKVTTNLQYSLVRLAECLNKSFRLPQVIASTKVSAFHQIYNDEKYGRERLQFSYFTDLPLISKDETSKFFMDGFGVAIPRGTLEYYDMCRPIFFRHLFTRVVDLLNAGNRNPTDDELGISRALTKDTARCMIEKVIDKPNYQELYLEWIMHNHNFTFSNGNEIEVVDTGMVRVRGAYPGACEGEGGFTFVIEESIILTALEEIVPHSDPNKDIVFLALNNMQEYVSNRRKYSKYVTSRLLMRQEDFSSISIPNIALENTIGMSTNFKIAMCGDSKDIAFLEKSPHVFKYFEKIAENNILMFPTKKMKPDILFCGKNSGMNVVCGVVCRNYAKNLTNADFEADIDSLDPWNFFSGYENLQKSFFKWWLENGTVFDHYIRVIVCFHGFNPSVVEMVKKHNQKYGKTQPIILVEATESIIGKTLSTKRNMSLSWQQEESREAPIRNDFSIHFDKSRAERIVIGSCNCQGDKCDPQNCNCKRSGVECQDNCRCKKKCQEKLDDSQKSKKKKM